MPFDCLVDLIHPLSNEPFPLAVHLLVREMAEFLEDRRAGNRFMVRETYRPCAQHLWGKPRGLRVNEIDQVTTRNRGVELVSEVMKL